MGGHLIYTNDEQPPALSQFHFFGNVKSVILHSDFMCFFIDVHLHLAEVFSCVFLIK